MRVLRHSQRGVVAAVVAVAVLALLLMAALAIDVGHLVLNKSRLQSTVDAAALAAAKVLDQTGSEAQASSAARGIFDANAANQPELSDVLSGADIVVQYSATLDPFEPGAADDEAQYVRVIANNFTMWSSFARLAGFDQFVTAASAVAGPSAPIGSPCDLFPVAVCADMTQGAPYWGYVPYGQAGSSVVLLKLASAAAGSTFGPGNFQLIRLGGTGAAVVRRNMAGGAACAPPGEMIEVDPQPGNVTGPIAQGMNTRFGMYAGTMGGQAGSYPPDLVTTPAPQMPLDSSDGTSITNHGEPVNGIDDVDFSYSNYLAAYAAGSYTDPQDGRAQRRLVTVPIVDCTNPVPGTSDVLPIKAFGSFFLLQPLKQSGNESWIFAQFIGEGIGSGVPGPGPGYGPYKIVLHNDPDSEDS